MHLCVCKANEKSNIKLKRAVIIDRDEMCENFPDDIYRMNYNRSIHFCSNITNTCAGDGPVMGIDTIDSNNPFWYIFGFFLYSKGCAGTPRIFIKVLPHIQWIHEKMLID